MVWRNAPDCVWSSNAWIVRPAAPLWFKKIVYDSGGKNRESSCGASRPAPLAEKSGCDAGWGCADVAGIGHTASLFNCLRSRICWTWDGSGSVVGTCCFLWKFDPERFDHKNQQINGRQIRLHRIAPAVKKNAQFIKAGLFPSQKIRLLCMVVFFTRWKIHTVIPANYSKSCFLSILIYE